MWFATVWPLMNSSAPISRLLRPVATSRRTSTSRDDSSSGSGARRAASPPSSRARAEHHGQAGALGERRGVGQQRGRALRRRRRGRGPERPAVGEERVGDPRRRVHPPVERERVLEVVGGEVVLAQRRGEQPEVAVGRAVAHDAVADRDVAAGERRELRVEQRGELGVAHRGARIGEVGERRQPERRAQPVEALAPDVLELAPRLGLEAELREERGQTGAPGAARGVAADEEAHDGATARRGGPARGGC